MLCLAELQPSMLPTLHISSPSTQIVNSARTEKTGERKTGSWFLGGKAHSGQIAARQTGGKICVYTFAGPSKLYVY
jgi:hypothetical protein